MGVICSKTNNNKSKINNINNNKIIKTFNPQENNKIKPIEENNKIEEKKKTEIILSKNDYYPNIYGENKIKNNNIENKLFFNPIRKNSNIIRKESKRITTQKRETIKFLQDFKKNFEIENKNYLLKHLVRKLTRNINNNNLEDNLKKKQIFQNL